MSRNVLITGLGPVSGAGLGIDANWSAISRGHSAIAPIRAFNAEGFTCRIAAEVMDFKVRDYVPKSYRKATKVMARDIELAVAAANLAARDAGLLTKGTDPDADPSYAPARLGAHIGAGLIAAEQDELTYAFAQARDQDGRFDIHKWGREGMTSLTPLWLLKYLPNMLACHVTIIHDAQGPSNTITCNEASSGLSVGESLRVIQRGAADLCFCGGAESKLNPMALLRQQLTGRLVEGGLENPSAAVRPFDQEARGTALGEGGAILILEAQDTFAQRDGGQAYARITGFGASQSVHRASRNRQPDPEGLGIASAIKQALAEADAGPDDIDLIVPFAGGWPPSDHAEAAALRGVFGKTLERLPVPAIKAVTGKTGAGAGGLDLTAAAMALYTQTLPATINREHPLRGFAASSSSSPAPDKLERALVYSTGFGGQNNAVVLERA